MITQQGINFLLNLKSAILRHFDYNYLIITCCSPHDYDMATVMRALVVILVLLISVPLLADSQSPSTAVGSLDEVIGYGVLGVEPEFNPISVEPRVEFPDDDGRTLQLLKPGAGHDQLELNQMVVERLASIEGPVSFVSVVGPYHGFVLQLTLSPF